jgi:hypothetical protein
MHIATPRRLTPRDLTCAVHIWIQQTTYRGAHGVLITFDLTDRSTFNVAPTFLREKERYGA